jgi:Fe-S-cluster containining protein
MTEPIKFLNLDEARFECTFGRGCEGICCRNGRPPVRTDEAERIDSVLDRALPLMRPEAQALVKREGYLSNRQKYGAPALRVAGGWCVFFHRGCVLHVLGMEDGETHRHKPTACSLFPLERDKNDHWYVRQAGYLNEQWNELPCLNPTDATPLARDTMKEELEIAKKVTDEESRS